MAERVTVAIGQRSLSLSNLDKVMYPKSGFTKGEVIDYYARVAEVMVPHIEARCLTFRRWPDGVEGKSFFAKNCPDHRPKWVQTAFGRNDEKPVNYCRIDEPAALVWAANLAALEIHSPLVRVEDLFRPDLVVFDLDPGPPATITQCCAVALELADLLESLNLKGWAKTSGSKGLQVYVPVEPLHERDKTAGFALACGKLVARKLPKQVVVEMNKDLRKGKVYIDWLQNRGFRTTIAPYSLRGGPAPTVSTPVTWAEVEAGAAGAPLSFQSHEVTERIDKHGDLFGDLLECSQQLPDALLGATN